MNINTLLGPAVMAFGGYLTYNTMNTSADVGMMDWLKALGALTVGGGVTAYNSFSYLKGVVSNFRKGTPLLEQATPSEEPVGGIAILSEEEKDMSSIYYLTERCKTEGKGLDICRQLNDLFFSIHHAPTAKIEEKK